jgi:hypothetical protein
MRKLLLLAVSLTACGKGPGTLCVPVDSSSPVAEVDHFHLTVVNHGQTATADVPLSEKPVSIPPSRSFSLVFGKDRDGEVDLTVEADNAAGDRLASGTATATVHPSESSDVTVTLGGLTGGDGGNRGDADVDGGDAAACVPTLAACPATAGCGSYDDGCNHLIDCGPCSLLAIYPELANAGDILTLEGAFGASVDVQFPGGVSQSATVLGPNRASILVPAGAGAGPLSVTTLGQSVGSLNFRELDFVPALQEFRKRYEQTDVARIAPGFATPNSGAASIAIGNYLYLLGGSVDLDTQTDEIQRALINADGTLNPFQHHAQLASPRANFKVIRSGDFLYAVGGETVGGRTSSVERAPIGAGGSLGAFTLVSGVTLRTPRENYAAGVVGNRLYVAGGYAGAGFSRATTGSVEVAVAAADGTLGDFTAASASTLNQPRTDAVLTVTAKYLYALGGGGWLPERAEIGGDGTIGAWSSLGGTSLNGSIVFRIGGEIFHVDDTASHVFIIQADSTLAPVQTTTGIHPRVPARTSPAIALVGNYVYLLGGDGDGPATIERASFVNSAGTFAAPVTPGGALRTGNANLAVGPYVYRIGGSDAGGLTVQIDRATVAADGSLGVFSALSGVQLPAVRDLPNALVTGAYVYLVGAGTLRAPILADGDLGAFTSSGPNLAGFGAGDMLFAIDNTVYALSGGAANGQKADVAPDGTLGVFSTVANLPVPPVSEARPLVLDDAVFLLGGSNSNPLATVFRSAINADGGVPGAFNPDAGTVMNDARYGQGVAVVGSFAYAFLGQNLTTVESAQITGSSLGAFQRVAPLSVPRFEFTTMPLGNFVHVVGGVNASALIDTRESAPLQ